jgi:peptide chain release factor subunit 1
MADKVKDKDKYKLKRFLKELEDVRGRGTELVSVYVPSGYDINKINTHISEEQGTASNIKSKQTRDAVIASLEKIIQHLKLYDRTPENGLAVFSGNVSERDGQQDYRVWSIIPPIPLNQRLYRCDKEFVLEPLQKMVEDKDSYGLVVMDRREANIALLKGKTIIPLVSAESMVPGKFRAGGQSAQRFAKNRELAARDFYKKIGDMMQDQFFELKDLRGIMVGGPGPTKYEFTEGNFIMTELRNKIIAVRDLSYTDEYGLQELLEKCQDVLAEESVMIEKKLVAKFFNLLAKNSGMVTYGKDHCRKALDMAAVETLLVSEIVDEGVVDELISIGDNFGTEVEVISTETMEGNQLKDIGGFAAILRYDIGDTL